MTPGIIAEPTTKDGVFEVEAVQTMHGLRGAFLRLIEAVPAEIHRAADLERALGVSTTLAWQIHKVATSPNPLATGADVPGLAATKHFLEAARARGVAEEHLQGALAAMEAFELLVARHAGDRTMFATMINSLAGSETETIDFKTRRQAFRLSSQIWGVQVKTILSCGIYHPGSKASLFEIASIRGAREIRRLRVDAPFRLSSQQITDGRLHTIESRALANGATSNGRPSLGPNLLLEYCTKPYPELDNRIEGGISHTYLRATPLGNAGLQTLYLADVAHDVEWAMPDDDPNFHYKFNSIMKPAEALVLDALVYRGMFGKLAPTVQVLGSLDRLGERDPERYADDEILPVPAEVHHLGGGLSVLPTPHVPRYPDMVNSVCRRIGWNPEDFELFRCIVEYPLINTMVRMRIDLPDRGNW